MNNIFKIIEARILFRCYEQNDQSDIKFRISKSQSNILHLRLEKPIHQRLSLYQVCKILLLKRRLDSNIKSKSSKNIYLNIIEIFNKLLKELNIIESRNLVVTSTKAKKPLSRCYYQILRFNDI